MPPRRQKNPSTSTQSNVSSRANNHEKHFVYQSSLEQFMKPITSTATATQKYQFTTPNKRKPQTSDTTTCSYPSKKRKRSSRSPPAMKSYETAASGADVTTPIIVLDNSDDEIWDGDTLINSASTTRTLCADLEKTTFGSKSQFILKEPDHTPSTTPPRSRSPPSAKLTFSPSDRVSTVIPSSQIHERLSPLAISLRDEELRVSDSQPPPPSAEEIIPSSQYQSQYLLPYVISPQRVRKFIGKPPPSPKEIIPCSQGLDELDLVLLARSRGFDTDPKGPRHESQPAIKRVEDSPDESDGKADRPPLTDQSNLEPGQQFRDCLDVFSLTPPTTNQTEEHAEQDTRSTPAFEDIEFSQFESSQSFPPSSLSSYGRNDSQYTFVEETCPSDIHEFLEELDKRTDIEFSPSEIPPTQEFSRASCLLRPESGELIDEKMFDTCSSLSLPASSSQFSFGPSSQYTSMEVSLPSDIAEFLDRLEEPLDSEAED